jgi:hypothetical protein
LAREDLKKRKRNAKENAWKREINKENIKSKLTSNGKYYL